ncbi:MAG: hypothetical protein ACRD4G_07150 [Bryobacteraceae bacterium]
MLSPEVVGSTDELGLGPLLSVSRKEYFTAQIGLEVSQSSPEAHSHKFVFLPWIDPHAAILGEVD